jgi:hypothetical protein
MIKLSFEQHWRVRRSEWLLSLAVLLLGMLWGAHPQIFQLQTFSAMRGMLAPATWAAIGMAIGLARVTVLYVNGVWHASPHMRAGAAFCSGFLWTALFLAALASDELGVGVVLWPLFFFFDALSAVDAAADARASDLKTNKRIGARQNVHAEH